VVLPSASRGVGIAIFDYCLGNALGFCGIPDNIYAVPGGIGRGIGDPSNVTGEIADAPGGFGGVR
jgi:hypothetical protein